MYAGFQFLVDLEGQPGLPLFVAHRQRPNAARRGCYHLIKFSHVSSLITKSSHRPHKRSIPRPFFSSPVGFLPIFPAHSRRFLATSELDIWLSGSPPLIDFRM